MKACWVRPRGWCASCVWLWVRVITFGASWTCESFMPRLTGCVGMCRCVWTVWLIILITWWLFPSMVILLDLLLMVLMFGNSCFGAASIVVALFRVGRIRLTQRRKTGPGFMTKIFRDVR